MVRPCRLQPRRAVGGRAPRDILSECFARFSLFALTLKEAAMPEVINPATEKVFRTYDLHSEHDMRAKVEKAQQAFAAWREKPLEERAQLLTAAARQLRARRDACAVLATEEMGKPITEARSEVEKCATVCDYYAQHAEAFLKPRDVATDASRSLVRYDPLGVVLGIMPWNFPFWQAFRFAAPTLAAGNTVLLKHASNVPGCAMMIESLFADAGFPEGVFTTLLIESSSVGSVIAHPAVQAVSLTGSDAAGAKVAAQAGEHLKKCVLELGGSDPFIVLADANIDEVAAKAVQARCINSGQSCIAAKRFIVEAAVYDAFTERMRQAMLALKIGDPRDEATQVGPLARRDLLESLHEQVQRSVAAGAVPLVGGAPLEQTGFFYAPTLLAEVTPHMPAFAEETFGPVAAVIRADNVDHAVALANRSQFGLGASIWTADRNRGLELAARIEAGCVFINDIVRSDPRLPFGGVKRSGYGRELGELGIHEFVNIKTVYVA